MVDRTMPCVFRVLAVLIDVLLRRQFIAITDLPFDAPQRLYPRNGHRKTMLISVINLLAASPR